MAQSHLKQWLLGAGGALLLSGSALAIPQSSPPAGQAQSQQQTQQEGKALPNQAKKSDISKLEKQAQAYGDAWNQKDSQKISRLFTSNAAVLSPSGETAVGRQEIEKAYSKELEKEQLKDAQMQTRVETVRQLKPDLALIDTVHTVTGPNLPQGQALEVHAVSVAQKQGNEWRFRELRAIRELPEDQLGIGGSGEQPSPAPESGAGGSGEAPAPPVDSDLGGSAGELPPSDPGTGGSGSEPQPIEPGTGGSGSEPQPTEPGDGGSGPEAGEQRTPPSGGFESP
ncbi:MAG TPA: SgcJ/EcaC family oxidoreductase [Myxococcaceae bacterium]|nr:SgcJ/EcaC family oxidoreductase [Myxococcaceae bacterium]